VVAFEPTTPSRPICRSAIIRAIATCCASGSSLRRQRGRIAAALAMSGLNIQR
jgi:hypothetical protein